MSEYPNLLQVTAEPADGLITNGESRRGSTDILDDMAQLSESAATVDDAQADADPDLMETAVTGVPALASEPPLEADATVPAATAVVASASPRDLDAEAKVAPGSDEPPATTTSWMKRAAYYTLSAVLVLPLSLVAIPVATTALVAANVRSRTRAHAHRRHGDAAVAVIGSVPPPLALVPAGTTAAPPSTLVFRHQIRVALNQLKWERYDAYLEGFLNTHGAIVNRPRGFHRMSYTPKLDAMLHLTDHFAWA